MSFLTINADEQNSELSMKSAEQHRLELERFEELKASYRAVVNYIKENDLYTASNVLLNFLDSELFTLKSFDAKQLQKAVLKLILSLNMTSSERQLSICLQGIELFPDEKIFWERCGELLTESHKYEEAIDIYSVLFRNDPYSIKLLKCYVDCLKKSFKFDELDNLKNNLKSSNWIDEESEGIFDWRSEFPSFFSSITSNTTTPNNLEVLLVPFRDNINWTNYASILHAMAVGNYTKVFRKQPFNPENYSILNGPCVLEIVGNNANSTLSQNFLVNSIHDYSNSSMDDLSKKRSLRRKESRATQSIPVKSEQTVADLVKHLKAIFNFEEQVIIDTLYSTERSCLQLLDKNNIVKSSIDPVNDSDNNSFTLELLNQRLHEDNEVKKPIAQRICEFVIFFFHQSLSPNPQFPKSLAKPMIDLWSLFKSSIFSIEILKSCLGIEKFCELLLSVCEVYFSLKFDLKDYFYELSLFKSLSKSPINSRLLLLEIFSISDESLKLTKLQEIAKTITTPICTRYTDAVPSLISCESISLTIEKLKLEKTIEKAEEYCKNGQQAVALELFGSDIHLINLVNSYHGEMRLRLCKLVLNCVPSTEHVLTNAISELIQIHSDLEITTFLDYTTFFFNLCADKEALPTDNLVTLTCMYWNIFSRKSFLQNGQTPALNESFALFLSNDLLKNNLSAIDLCKFSLSWMAQEKCFGCLNGLVPLKIFSSFSQSTDFSEMKFAYSVILSLFRFPNIFPVMDSESGFDEWDRSPIGIGSRDTPCPPLTQSEFIQLADLIRGLDETIDQSESKIVTSEPGFVNFVDWSKKQFFELDESNAGKQFFHCISLNRNHIRTYLNSPLELHAQKQVLNPSRGHFDPFQSQSFKYLLNTRSDIVYSELQGRKKSLEILKTIRSDLKLSLSLNINDADVWKLLGTCYHDAAVHFMSSEAEVIAKNLGKLKRCVKKAILALKCGLSIEPSDQNSWMKLSDLIDWSVHEPSSLSSDPEIIKFLCAIGCSCIQNLLPNALPRDRWILLLRLELFLRKSGTLANDTEKQLELLKEACLAACSAYSENVYESTALYMSLVKLYSRLSKLRISDSFKPEDVTIWLDKVAPSLPPCLHLSERRENGDLILLDSFEALNTLDRKKIFHSHLIASAWYYAKIIKDTNAALTQLQQIFPFLKASSSQSQQKKNSSASLLQIYQSDHERPARFLICGRRYLLQLIDFISQLDCGQDLLLIQFLKKLHYIRKTILGFPEILTKATLAYLKCPQPDQAIVKELIDSLMDARKGNIPVEIKNELINLNNRQLAQETQ